MKNNTTPIWLVLAVALAAGVWFVQKHFSPVAPANPHLLAGLRAGDVTSIQIVPANAREISAVRTNQSWFLEKPVAYPASSAAIQPVLAALEKILPLLRLTAAEVARKNADAEFGLENPQFRIDLTAGDQSWHLNVGKLTAPGDGVYVRLVGGAGVYVVSVDWLAWLPHEASAWRDPALVSDLGAVDCFVITNGAKIIELRRDPTNRLWRMIRPLPARADGVVVTAALSQLRAAKVSKCVTDDAKADLSLFGLQPAELDISLGHGTNFFEGLHVGKETSENAGQIYLRREGWNSVLAAAKETMSAWRGDANNFRDPHLLDFTAPVAEIEVRGENNFTLHREGANGWVVAGEKFPVDMENLQLFVRLLANLRVTEFVKDTATATDLQGFGLAPTNSRSVTMRSVPGDTNAVIAQLIFGAAETNRVFVKRGDEDFIYALAPQDVAQLPIAGWQFRDRRLWNFSETNLAQISVHQAGKQRQLVHTGAGKWALASGSQGMVDTVGLEETAKQFATLSAAWWMERNFTTSEKFGFNTNALQLDFEMKSGEKLTVNFGADIPSQNAPTAFANVTLDGERWAFVLPPPLWQLADAFLKIVPGQP
jgi:hypothetical protein